MEERIIKDINDLLAQLFQKMHEAGYEWDADKKELKKIEQKYTPKHKVGDTIYYNSFGEVKSMIVSNVITDDSDVMYEDEDGNDVFEKDLIEQNTVWSEEGEDYINDLIKYFSQNEGLKNTKEDIVIWLNSIRPQNRWKPSEEQIKALDFAIDCTVYPEFNIQRSVLKELLEQLKKLREE